MIWTEQPLAFFDLETTAPEPTQARIVTGCIGRVDGSQVSSKQWLADPGVEIPDEAAAIHGISTEHAREHGRPHHEVVAEIIAELAAVWKEGRVLCIYNANYDLTVLHTQSAGRFQVTGPVADPFVMDRQLDQYRKGSRKLGDVCAHYGVRLDEAHNAEADAVAAARLVWKLARRYPILQLISADELMERQASWHKERQRSYAEYLIRQKKSPIGVDGSWPIRSAA